MIDRGGDTEKLLALASMRTNDARVTLKEGTCVHSA